MSTIIASNISDGTTSVPSTYVVNGSAKAWVNFNGTGTIAARDSFNTSSLTDNGTGHYTANFTNAMGSENYATTFAGGQKASTWGLYLGDTTYGSTTTGHTFYTVAPNDVAYDTSYVSLIFVGDLA
jgi:hypothetical protein